MRRGARLLTLLLCLTLTACGRSGGDTAGQEPFWQEQHEEAEALLTVDGRDHILFFPKEDKKNRSKDGRARC